MKIVLGIFFCFLFITSCEADNSFALSEHLALGQNIIMQFEGHSEKNALLHLPNGLAIHYADIISLGDLYAVMHHPISAEKSERNQQQRFLGAFYTLALEKESLEEAPKLLAVIHGELDQVQQAMAEGLSAEEAYKKTANEVGRQINCLTGGACSGKWWLIPGRYLFLAMDNIDHFSPQAEQVYQIGHAMALAQAITAHQSQKRQDLELAYALEAYADHYLSDLFAAGHQRTPRVELPAHVTPSIVGLLLVNFMHNEENQASISIADGFGRQWTMFGDCSYFNPSNALNQTYLQQALQQGVDELFTTYTTGELVHSDYLFFPHPLNKETDISPLFYWDKVNQKLLRRENMADLHDKNYTANWWGWTTLIALKKLKGLPVEMQALWQKAIKLNKQLLKNEAQ